MKKYITKISVLLFLAAFFLLPAKILATTVTPDGNTVKIIVPSSEEASISDITVLRNDSNLNLSENNSSRDANGNITITDRPEPPGAYTYVVKVFDKEKTYQVTTTNTPPTTTPSSTTSGILNTNRDSGRDPADQNLGDVERIIANVGNLALTIASFIAVLFIIVGAYHYFFAFGNEETATTGKKTITYAIVGLVILMISKIVLFEVWNFIATDANQIHFLF